MWVFTSVADWIDDQGKQSDAALDRWVEDSHYSQGAMITAATTHAFMKFGASMSDIMRLGDGVKKGGLSGWGGDAMRFVAIFPFGKAAQMARSAMLVRDAKLIKDIAPGAGICSWVGTTKALAQTGHQVQGQIYAHVADLAKAVGVPIENLGGISLESMAHNLHTLGAKIGILARVRSLEEILSKGLLKRDGSVVLISVRCMRAGQDVGGHMIYAFYDALGRLRFMDRTIRGAAQNTYSSLEEIAAMYRMDAFIPRAAVPLYNVFVKSVGLDLPRLAMPINAVVAEYKDQKTQGAKPAARR